MTVTPTQTVLDEAKRHNLACAEVTKAFHVINLLNTAPIDLQAIMLGFRTAYTPGEAMSDWMPFTAGEYCSIVETVFGSLVAAEGDESIATVIAAQRLTLDLTNPLLAECLIATCCPGLKVNYYDTDASGPVLRASTVAVERHNDKPVFLFIEPNSGELHSKPFTAIVPANKADALRAAAKKGN